MRFAAASSIELVGNYLLIGRPTPWTSDGGLPMRILSEGANLNTRAQRVCVPRRCGMVSPWER